MIIGITGTNGAGKGTVVEYLVDQKGFTHYSARAEITREVESRGLPLNRTNLNEVATDLREKHGPNYFSDLFMRRAREQEVENAVLESIRNPLEADNIKEHGGFMVAVDADRKVRYDRISSRASETDKVSFEEFCVQEDREMTSEDPSNPAKMSIRDVIARCDATLMNDGSREELYTQIEAMLERFRGMAR